MVQSIVTIYLRFNYILQVFFFLHQNVVSSDGLSHKIHENTRKFVKDL